MILTPLSDHPFYLWQALVQMHALQGQRARWLVYCPTGSPSSLLASIMRAGVADVTAWPDWDRDRAYNPACKPWLVGKWLTASGWDGAVHVIDPDVIPTGRPITDPLPGVLLGTDTDSYTGPAWLDSKGALDPLCDLVGVRVEEVRAYLGVGAQYVTQGIPGAWWEDVARTSVAAFHLLKSLPADAQPWCAEMYVTQLAAIRDGYRPTIAPAMGMVWTDGPASGWETAGYFHDAGVVTPRPGAFHKGSHQSWPREIPPVDPGQAAHRYVEHIHATEAAWPELVALFP